jgi:hypothetical protein
MPFNEQTYADDLRLVLLNIFNGLLEDPSLCDAERFATLPDATLKLVQQHFEKSLTHGRLLRLNRMLLEAAYPMEVANRSQGRAVRTIAAYELLGRDCGPTASGPQETSASPTLETGGGDSAGVQAGKPPNLPDDADSQTAAGEAGSGSSPVSPLEAVEKAVEKALDDHQHDALWVQDTITALAHNEDGKFIWLKALLPGEEVDWAAMHAYIKDGLAVKGLRRTAYEYEF